MDRISHFVEKLNNPNREKMLAGDYDSGDMLPVCKVPSDHNQICLTLCSEIF